MFSSCELELELKSFTILIPIFKPRALRFLKDNFILHLMIILTVNLRLTRSSRKSVSVRDCLDQLACGYV